MLSDCQNLNRLTGYRGRLHSAHWLASSLKLAAPCPVSGCWPSCYIYGYADISQTNRVNAVNANLFRTISTGTVHTSAKARLTSVDRHQNLIILFTGSLLTFPENFMQIRSEVLSKVANKQTDRQTDKQGRKHNQLGGCNNRCCYRYTPVGCLVLTIVSNFSTKAMSIDALLILAIHCTQLTLSFGL